MTIFKNSEVLKKYLAPFQSSDSQIGFVPTMGALHKGHISLLEISKKKCATTVCSIFVNPTQFNDVKDYENYPITIGKDILQLEKAGCDVLFLPRATEIYPTGINQLPEYDLGFLETILEGKYRPNHFQGVCQVVDILVNLVNPDVLFIGQKDYQQCMVIKRLLKIVKSKVMVIIGSTCREPSGLAMSSRNQRLTEPQKEQATAIYKMLLYIKQHINSITPNELSDFATTFLLSNGFNSVDYVCIADAATLEQISTVNSNPKVALIAAKIGDVRLIDNMLL